MENSLLSKLPPELRLEIYSYVFEGAEVVIHTLQQSYAYPLGIFRCSEHASLIKTCRDLRNEALPVLFTKAVVVAKGSGKYMTLSKLNEVIGDHAAQHISHIRNIRLPKRRASSAPILRSTMGLLGKYPKLKTCGIWVGSEHFTETEWSSSIITQHVSIELDARPLCFGPKRSPRSFCSHEETITAPKSILKNVYGIDEACKVHFVRSCQLMRRSWNRVDRDVEEYNLEPMDDCQTPSLAPVSVLCVRHTTS